MDAFFSGLEDYEVIVLHMAAIISIQDKVSDAVYNVNVNGTKNVIDKCFEYHVSRLLYVSSVHAVPEPDKITTITEVDQFSKDAVLGAYAITKAAASQLVIEAGKRGLDIVIVHPSGITGPGDLGRNHMTQLMQMYLHHKLPMGVEGGYDFVDVRDVAARIIAAADKGRSGQCYLLSNRYVTIAELLECMRLATGRKAKKGCCPYWLAKAAAPAAELIAKASHTRPIFTSYSLKTVEANGHFCHDKATMELGYHPRDIKYTVKDTMDYLVAHGA
jgi:dihydroflavonol-4-reductase